MELHARRRFACAKAPLVFNNYSPKAKLTILTEPEVNNCFRIYTRIEVISTESEKRKPWKKRLVWLTGEFMRDHEAINRCAKVKSLQYLQTWQMIVLPNSEKKSGAYLFLSTHREWESFPFVASCKCCQQRLRSRWALFISNVLCFVNLLACTISENICLPLSSIN